MRRIATAVVVLGLMAASAAADDMWDPPWDMTVPGATYQVWDFTMEPDGPFIVENPFGDPMIEWPAFVNYEEIIGPDDTPVGAWHIGGEPGTTSPVTVWVPNNPDENEVKIDRHPLALHSGTGHARPAGCRRTADARSPQEAIGLNDIRRQRGADRPRPLGMTACCETGRRE